MTTSQAAGPSATPAQALSFRELLRYTEQETERWERWLAAHPEALDVTVGEGRFATVRGVIHHIFAVERRYADRLRDEPVTGYEAIATGSVAELFASGRDARSRLAEYLAGASDESLGRELEFQTLSAGTQRASARKVVAHALVHGIRHWAQLATVLRQQGHATEWFHDLLMSDALD